MKIRPTDETLRQVFERGFYVIPRFQRPYSWEREHVEDFWDDAIASDDNDYFIGSMVVFPEGQDRNTYSIVDGQQRLTTITLLLAALRNGFRNISEEALARGTQGLLERRD